MAAPVLDGYGVLLAPTPLELVNELDCGVSPRFELLKSVELVTLADVELGLLILVDANKPEDVVTSLPVNNPPELKLPAPVELKPLVDIGLRLLVIVDTGKPEEGAVDSQPDDSISRFEVPALVKLGLLICVDADKPVDVIENPPFEESPRPERPVPFKLRPAVNIELGMRIFDELENGKTVTINARALVELKLVNEWRESDVVPVAAIVILFAWRASRSNGWEATAVRKKRGMKFANIIIYGVSMSTIKYLESVGY